ncbi:glycoside hydrolase domain-containing protein [Thiomonas sp.]
MKVGLDTAEEVTAFFLATATSWLGQKPDFVGRYLGTGGGAATPLTQREALFIRSQGVAILPIYNDSPLNGGAAGTEGMGRQDALKACAWAGNLGVPTGTVLACDIEARAPVNAAWMVGWADAMRASVYWKSGLLYGTNHLNVLLNAMPTTRALENLFTWVAQYDTGGEDYRNALNLRLQRPSPFSSFQTRAWQFARDVFSLKADQDLADDTLFDAMWHGTPVTVAGTVSTAGPPTNVTSALAKVQAAMDLLVEAKGLL